MSHGLVVPLQRGPLSTKRTGVGLAVVNGPASYMSGPEVSVSVPLEGVAAKLYIASVAPIAQSRKAAKMRGFAAPDPEPGFVFIAS